MLEGFAWQRWLLRGAGAVGLLGILAVIAGAAVTVTQLQGVDPNQQLGQVAVPFILAGSGALLVLLLGVLLEIEVIRARFPHWTKRRAIILLVLCGVLMPILNLIFWVAIYVVAVTWLLSKVSTQTTVKVAAAGFTEAVASRATPRIAAVAISDAVLCLCLTEVLRHAGSAGDYYSARAMHLIYGGIPGGMLPALAIIASLSYRPKLSFFVVFFYIVCALHSIGVALQGLFMTVSEAFNNGAGTDFGGGRCIRSLVPSPLGLAIDAVIAFGRQSKYDYTGPQRIPCPSSHLSTDVLPTVLQVCDDLYFGLECFLVLGGLYVAFVNVVYTLWDRGYFNSKRVSPSETMRGTSSIGLGSLASLRSFREFRKGYGLGRPAIMALVCIFVGGGGLAAMGIYQALPCTEPIPIELRGLPPSPAPTPIHRNASNFSSFNSSFRRLASNTTKTSVNFSNSSNSSNSSNGSNSTLLGSGNVTNIISTGCQFAAAPPPVAPVETRICGCHTGWLRGWYGLIAVPAEQMAIMWCNLGYWASVLLSSLILIMHGLAAGMVLAALRVFEAEEVEKARRIAQHTFELRAAACGRTSIEAAAPSTAPSAFEQQITVYREARQDEFPHPTIQIGTNRIFSV